MTPELLAALALFAFVASITPGPNNTMLLASGVNFGLRRTAPHLAGVCLGFLVLLWSVGLGLGALFSAYPMLHTVLKVAGGLYMLYLAFKIATSRGIGAGKSSGRPQTFLQAAAFQWVNPKAWAMAIGALTAYAPSDRYLANVVVVGLVFAAVNGPCVVAWAGVGVVLRRFLDRPGVLRAFNVSMGLLLAASLYPLAEEAWRALR
jgi:threonine/homoserine/homoserine lactone efflux protein